LTSRDFVTVESADGCDVVSPILLLWHRMQGGVLRHHERPRTQLVTPEVAEFAQLVGSFRGIEVASALSPGFVARRDTSLSCHTSGQRSLRELWTDTRNMGL
jgi:hypothetical protein